MEQINTVEVIKLCDRLVGKYCKAIKIKEPDFALLVGYKAEPKYEVVPLGNVNETGYSLLGKMVCSTQKTSKNLSKEHGNNIGAVRSEGMLVVMMGIENDVAEAILAKMLHIGQVLSSQEYQEIKEELNRPKIFSILEK